VDKTANDSKYLISVFDNYTKDSGLVVPFEDPKEEEALDVHTPIERLDIGKNKEEVRLS